MKIVPISNDCTIDKNNNINKNNKSNKINNTNNKSSFASPIRQLNHLNNNNVNDDSQYISVGKVKDQRKDRQSRLGNNNHALQMKIQSKLDQQMSFGSLVQSSSSMPSFYNPKKSSSISGLKHTKLQKRDSIVSQSTDFVMDSRNNNSQSSCMADCRKLPIARALTFLLMYQIVITFCVLVAVKQTMWVLAGITVLVFPTYYACKCIYHRHTQTVTSHNQSRIQYSRSVSESASKSMKPTKISNSFHSDNNTNTYAYSYSKQQNPGGQNSNNHLFSKYNSNFNTAQHQHQHQHQHSHRSYMLVIPYLHNNQLQSITKCKQCPSTHINSRIKHCHKCNICHIGYDHYCKWLALCIDAYNYSYFIKFIISNCTIGFIFICATIYMEVIWGIYSQQIHNNTMMHSSSTIVYIIITGIVILQIIVCWLFSTYVLIYHIWLTIRGVSTRQHFSNHSINCNNSIFCKSLQHSYPLYYTNLFVQELPVSSSYSSNNNLCQYTMFKEENQSNSHNNAHIGNADSININNNNKGLISSIRTGVKLKRQVDVNQQSNEQDDDDVLTEYQQEQFNKMTKSITLFDDSTLQLVNNQKTQKQKSEIDCNPSGYYDRKSNKSNSKSPQKQNSLIVVKVKPTKILQNSAQLHKQYQKKKEMNLSVSMTEKSVKKQQEQQSQEKTQFNGENGSEVQSLSASVQIIPSGKVCKFIYKEEKQDEVMLEDDNSEVDSLSKLSHRDRKVEQS